MSNERSQTVDDGKRTEPITFKVTERMALDLGRLSAADQRTLSDYLYVDTRRRLYGDVVRLQPGGQLTLSDVVDQ